MPYVTQLINKIIKLAISENPHITAQDLEDFIASKTYYEMEIDYDRPVKDIIVASNYSFYYNPGEDIFQPNDKGKKLVKFQYLKNSVPTDVFHAATGFEMISFYEKFKKRGLIALGSWIKSGEVRYFPSISFDRKLIISKIKTEGEIIYRPLVIVRHN